MNTNHSKQKWNIFIFLLSPIDNACIKICHPDEDTLTDDDDDDDSSLIAASNVFGDTIASSMSSLSLSSFDKQVRENWRRARKLQKRNNNHGISLLDNSITEDENENEYCEKLKKEEVATTTMKAKSVRPPLSPLQEKRKTKKKQKIHAPKTRSLLSLSRPPLSPPPKQEKKKNRLVLAREKMKYGKHRSTNTGKQQQKEILL